MTCEAMPEPRAYSRRAGLRGKLRAEHAAGAGRFSTTKLCFSCSESFWSTSRPSVSALPPARTARRSSPASPATSGRRRAETGGARNRKARRVFIERIFSIMATHARLYRYPHYTSFPRLFRLTPARAPTCRGLRWPMRTPATSNVMIQGKVYARSPTACWSVPRRIEGHGRHARGPPGRSRRCPSCSPTGCRSMTQANEPLCQRADRGDESAGARSLHRLAGVSLQNVETAIREMEHALKTLKFAGVEICEQRERVSIGDATLRAVFLQPPEKMGARHLCARPASGGRGPHRRRVPGASRLFSRRLSRSAALP